MAAAASPIEDTYLEVEKLIYDTVHKFVRRYGGRFEDIVEHVGSLSFMKSWESYVPDKGSFSGYLRFIVWHEALELRRRGACNHARLSRVDYDLHLEEAPSEFDKLGFLDELSHDARIVASLVLDMPRGLARAVSCKPDSPRHARTSIKDYLRGMGWDAIRIRESFAEVGRALVG